VLLNITVAFLPVFGLACSMKLSPTMATVALGKIEYLFTLFYGRREERKRGREECK